MAKGMKGEDGRQSRAQDSVEIFRLRAEQERLASELARLEADRNVEPAGRA